MRTRSDPQFLGGVNRLLPDCSPQLPEQSRYNRCRAALARGNSSSAPPVSALPVVLAAGGSARRAGARLCEAILSGSGLGAVVLAPDQFVDPEVSRQAA